MATLPSNRTARFWNVSRYAVADLIRDRFPTILCALAMFIGALYMLCLGSLAHAVFTAQRDQLMARLPEEICLLRPGGGLWFTPQRLAELRRIPGVRTAIGRIETPVEIRAGGEAWAAEPRRAFAAGRRSGNALAFREQRLASGRGFWSDRAREAVLPEALAELLGCPDEVMLRIGRHAGGEDQWAEIPVQVVGVVHGSEVDRLEIPFGLAGDLDAWCLGADVRGLPSRPDASFGSVPPDALEVALERTIDQAEGDALRRDLAAIGLEVERSIPDPSGRVLTLVVTATRGKRLSMEQVVRAGLLAGARSVRALYRDEGWLGEQRLEVEAREEPGATGPPPAGPVPVRLPRSLWARLGHQDVTATFRRGAGLEEARIRCQVIGPTEQRALQVPGGMLRAVRRWRDGRLRFDPVGQVFAGLPAPVRPTAFARATVFAESVDVVEHVSHELRRRGYETIDRAAEYNALRALGTHITVLVLALVAGSVLLGGLLVLALTTLRLRARTRTIGLLRIHGVPARRLVFVYAAQAGLLACAGFAAALFFFRGAAPAAFRALAEHFGLAADLALRAGTALPEWLPATVLAVTLTAALAGAVLPAAYIIWHMNPIEALRSEA